MFGINWYLFSVLCLNLQYISFLVTKEMDEIAKLSFKRTHLLQVLYTNVLLDGMVRSGSYFPQVLREVMANKILKDGAY